MKKIGILGGISYTSTLRYYEYLHELHYQHKGDYYYPEMVIESMNFQYFTDLENEGPQENYESYILKGLQDLQAAGSDFLIMAANSPHSVLADIRPHLAVPVLSIVDAVGRKAQSMGLKKLVLTGIRHTMKGYFYQEGLAAYGIEVIVPIPREQAQINDIIFSELVINKFVPTSRQLFLHIISQYAADGVILGCTELPQLISQKDTDLVLLNSLRLHCEEALHYAYQGERSAGKLIFK